MRDLRSTILIAVSTCMAAAAQAQSVPVETVESIAGLRVRIDIVRDREGVPHVRAGSEADAIFGLGFVHAQDRLWQLEYLRRLGTGRLSEILGPSSLPGDKLFRTLGLTQSASATWKN